MRRWKLYFKFDHLPEHLQAISRPFAEAAAALADGTDSAGFKPHLDACLGTVAGFRFDADQASFAREALNRVDDVIEDDNYSPSERLEALLVAKDAAVRANLPDPADAP